MSITSQQIIEHLPALKRSELRKIKQQIEALEKASAKPTVRAAPVLKPAASKSAFPTKKP